MVGLLGILATLACSPPEAVPGGEAYPAPLRRLTGAQLEHTVQDVFGVATSIDILVDPASHGFVNQAETQIPTPLLIEQLRTAAERIATDAMATQASWSACPVGGGPDPARCGADTVAQVGRRLFRRTLTAEERADFESLYAEVLADAGFDVALATTLEAMLLSPEFVYLPELGQPGATPGARTPLAGPEVAARLALLLWDAGPDDALIDAAERGELATADGVEDQAWRLLADPRSTRALGAFHAQWLGLDGISVVTPDPGVYFGWRPEAHPAAVRAEIDAFVLGVWQSDEPTLSALLLDRTTVADPLTSWIYRSRQEELPAQQRAGLLTRAGWLALTAHPLQPSPVKRGKFVLERLMCTTLAPPPGGVNTAIPEPAEGAVTNRDRYADHSARPECAGCHQALDPIGFAFEHYDAIGAWRDLDRGAAIDATGTFAVGDLAGASFDGALELSALLAGSRTVQDCVVTQWYRYALGRAEQPVDEPALSALRERFAAGGGDLRALLIDIVRSEAFRTL